MVNDPTWLRQWWGQGIMSEVAQALEGRLARYAVFPNLGPEPRDCLLFAKAVR